MKIREVHEEVKQMACTKFCSTVYRIWGYPDREEVECAVYVEGYRHGYATDFKTALQKLRANMAAGKEEEEQVEE